MECSKFTDTVAYGSHAAMSNLLFFYALCYSEHPHISQMR